MDIINELCQATREMVATVSDENKSDTDGYCGYKYK
jgi:hypothetical protein